MANSFAHIQFISAGAGSGKTYALTEKLSKLLLSGEISPSGVIATTFTKLAAGELQERVRSHLIAGGHVDTANAMGQAMIGTVNGVCGELLKRFSFEAGMSPDQRVIEGEEAQQLFKEALEKAIVSEAGLLQRMNRLSHKFQLVDEKKNPMWRSEVRAIVDAARSNLLLSDQLLAFSLQSANSLLALFPSPVKKDMNAVLANELTKAIASIGSNICSDADTTKGTKDYLDLIEKQKNNLDQDRLTWSDWIKLAKSKPTKKSAPLADELQSIAESYAQHPDLHSDINSLCHGLFLIAAKSMDEYQRLKRRQGLVDFVDQESQLYVLLDNPVVQHVLGNELQLLMVDEFQDTSPIQLAMFLKLSRLAKTVIWVGDVKQSIYGFRGSDPQLMRAVIDGISQQGVKPTILAKSWRSRPDLVAYVNEIFVPAFSNSLEAKQVSLSPALVSTDTGSVIEYWELVGVQNDAGKSVNNKETQANAIAAGLDALVNHEKRQIDDKNSKRMRQINYGDIVVLCRTNDNLAKIAAALTRQFIPVSYKRVGLLDTAEGTLALACLRRLADASDTLASAEIRFLMHLEKPESWLTDRLTFLQQAHPSKLWGEQTLGDSPSVPALAALSLLRDRLTYLTPVEAFEQALLVTNIRHAVCQWSGTTFQASQRLRNLDMLLQFSQDYLNHCSTQRLAATVPGLILWLFELNESEEDWQAQPQGNAVQLCTHHGAKGLEWPVVIAMDLDSDIKNRVWGLRVNPRQDGFLLDDPLKDRALQYWPAFFGGQSADIPLKDTIEQSALGESARLSAEEETKRLLYVSFTRARSLLILPFNVKKSTGMWLQALNADWIVPQDAEIQLPSGKIIATAKKVLQQVEINQNAHQEIHWLSAGVGAAGDAISARIQPSAMPPSLQSQVGPVSTYSERLPLTDAQDITQLGTALHAILANGFIQKKIEADNVQRILVEHGMADVVAVDHVSNMVRQFMTFIEKSFSPLAIHVEYPVQFFNDQGQKVFGWIDLLLETENGWILIDHKSSPHRQSEWDDIALGYSGQLAIYKQAIEAASQKKVLKSLIHFVVGGACVEIL